MKKAITYFLLLLTSFILKANNFNDNFVLSSLPIHFTNATIINKNTTRIPLKIVDRLLVIEGNIKGKNGNFIIDTGSETMILNKVHFKTYPFEQQNRKTTGIIDEVQNLFEKNVSKIAFKEITFHNKMSDIIDLSHIEESKKIKLLGIIGFSILKDFEIFIDLHLNQITLTKIDNNGSTPKNHMYLEKIVDTVNFKLQKHTIVLDGFINNKKIKFGLDTGAEFNQLDKRINKDALRFFYPKKRVRLVGASKRKIEVLYGNLFRVKLNDKTYFGPMKTIITNLYNMNKAFGTNLDGILGYDFFAQKRVILNYKKEQLYFIKYPLHR